MIQLTRRRLFSVGIAVAGGALVSCEPPTQDADSTSAVIAEIGESQGTLTDPEPDCLYIGDDPLPAGNGHVERFDALTGAYAGPFVDTGTSPLHTPRGMIFGKHGGPNADLLVNDQNVIGTTDPPIAGEILRYSQPNGTFAGALVQPGDERAPWSPQGIVLGKHHTLYVADVGQNTITPARPGRLATYDARTGEWLGDLDATPFTDTWGPRGLVFGPDGKLYASLTKLDAPNEGRIVRFDPSTGDFLDVFADNATCNCGLRRPAGLAFGPDGNLYVTSFQGASTETNKIVVFNGETGQFLDKIDLHEPGQTPVFARALLFGPENRLYVPVSVGTANIGQLRVYDIETLPLHDILVPTGGPLERPFYLTFCGTDPATLAYEPHGRACACGP